MKHRLLICAVLVLLAVLAAIIFDRAWLAEGAEARGCFDETEATEMPEVTHTIRPPMPEATAAIIRQEALGREATPGYDPIIAAEYADAGVL